MHFYSVFDIIGVRVEKTYTFFHGSIVMKIRKTGKIKRAVLLMTLAVTVLCMPFVSSQAYRRQRVRGTKINASNFPDDNFRTYVDKTFDKNRDGLLSANEIKDVVSIDLKKDFQGTNLKGISFFTELESFSVHADYWEPGKKKSMSFYVEEVDLSGNPKLKEVKIATNKIKGLDLSKNQSLELLYLASYQDEIDLTHNTALKELSIRYCKPEKLDLSQNTELTYLDLRCESLKKLDLSKNTKLEDVTVSCSLSDLDLTGHKHLKTLDVEGNGLDRLKVHMDELTRLNCRNNRLEKLKTEKAGELKELICDNNGISELDLSGCGKLKTLSCDGMKLTGLDLSHTGKLQKLSCAGNELESLDTTHCPDLKQLIAGGNRLKSINLKENNSLELADLSSNELDSLQLGESSTLTSLYVNSNRLTELDLSGAAGLEEVECRENSLKKIKTGKDLVYLNCEDNELTEVDVSASPRLQILCCRKNRLKALDVTGNKDLKTLLCDE